MSNDGKHENEFTTFDFVIMVLSIYVLLELIITSIFSLSADIKQLLGFIDDIICFVFLADFGIRFYKSENKLKFMRWGWIDLLSSIPTFGLLNGGAQYFMAGRVVRLFRLFRILRAFRSTEYLMKYLFKSKIRGTMMSVVLMTILMIISSSISVLLFEKGHDGSNINSGGDALWWAFETITTVGYGDRFPVTFGGRIVGVILMITGCGLFGTYTAYVASLLMSGKNRKSEENYPDSEN